MIGTGPFANGLRRCKGGCATTDGPSKQEEKGGREVLRPNGLHNVGPSGQGSCSCGGGFTLERKAVVDGVAEVNMLHNFQAHGNGFIYLFLKYPISSESRRVYYPLALPLPDSDLLS